MNWFKKFFGNKKSLDQKLKANYTFYANLDLMLEKEWQQEENLVLLLLEETGVGG